ncbi:hypothetical protein [Microbacterium istanbulense]|uniref:Dinucleotide-utilizing enzyme n=1 Tax=Microbacterium istanbulense TaxID=3122049 RepID=A0ABU8LN53_9MICO
MNVSLSRRIGFWFLAFVSVLSLALGGSLIIGQLGSMNTGLLDGTATAADVYVGQSLVVVGAVLVGAGLLGGMLTVAVSLLQAQPAATSDETAAPADTTPADEAAEADASAESVEDVEDVESVESTDVEDAESARTHALPVG